MTESNQARERLRNSEESLRLFIGNVTEILGHLMRAL